MTKHKKAKTMTRVILLYFSALVLVFVLFSRIRVRDIVRVSVGLFSCLCLDLRLVRSVVNLLVFVGLRLCLCFVFAFAFVSRFVLVFVLVFVFTSVISAL
jgi:hypothetical protein